MIVSISAVKPFPQEGLNDNHSCLELTAKCECSEMYLYCLFDHNIQPISAREVYLERAHNYRSDASTLNALEWIACWYDVVSAPSMRHHLHNDWYKVSTHESTHI